MAFMQDVGGRYIVNENKEETTESVLYPGESDCPENGRGLTVFLSYAVDRAADYKEIDPSGWASLLPGLFHYLEKNIQGIEAEEHLATKIWKIIGDEIIFTVDVRSLRDIVYVLFHANETLLKVNALMQRRTPPNDLGRKIQPDQVRRIRFKAAAWIAIVNNAVKHRSYHLDPEENLYLKYQEQTNETFGEYFGTDIDMGRKLTEYSRGGRMALSFELAYLLSETKERRFLQIISYEKIGSSFNNHGYPIIWYHRPPDERRKPDLRADFESSFAYDAGLNDEMVGKYLQMRKGVHYGTPSYPIAAEWYAVCEETMNKIAADAGVDSKIRRMKELAGRQGARREKPHSDFMKVDCAAMCYYIDEHGEIQLLALRTSGNYPGAMSRWCFGSADAYVEGNLTEALVRDYRADAGIDIAPLIYDSSGHIRESDRSGRMKDDPIPIALFERECEKSEGGRRKGIICVAKIQGTDRVPKCDGIYRAYRYITNTDLRTGSNIFGGEPMVDDFVRNAKIAMELIKKYE